MIDHVWQTIRKRQRLPHYPILMEQKRSPNMGDSMINNHRPTIQTLVKWDVMRMILALLWSERMNHRRFWNWDYFFFCYFNCFIVEGTKKMWNKGYITGSLDYGTIQMYQQLHPRLQLTSISKLAWKQPNMANLNKKHFIHNFVIFSRYSKIKRKETAINLLIIPSRRKLNNIENTNKQVCTTNLLEIKRIQLNLFA